MDEIDDISSEWGVIKSILGSKPQTESVDLRSEYMSMGDHPEFIYKLLDSTFGVASMSIWRCKCFGQKRVRRGGPHTTDCWITQYDVCLWKGARVDQHTSPHLRDLNRVFATPKNQSYKSLTEVLAAFVKARDVALKRTRDDIKRMRSDVERLMNDITKYETEADAMTGFTPPIDE